MAIKNYMTIEDLTLYKSLYDNQVADAIDTAASQSLHTVAIDGHTLKFYREKEPVGSATPAYSITLPETDISNLIEKIANASGGKIAATKSDGTIEESAIAISNVGLKSEISALENSLSDVATSGAAIDVEIADTGGYFTSDNVEGALAELASAASGGAASKTVWFRDDSSGQSEYAKVYRIYQGANAPEASTSPATLLGTINIPKDEVLQDADIVAITYSNGHLYDGSIDVTELIKGTGGTATVDDAGKYMKFIMQNVSDPLYANLSEFIDVYTGGTNSEATVSISNSNEITVGINEINGSKITNTSITKTKLASGVQTSLDLADSAVQSVTEGSANGSISVDGTSVAVHGLGTAAYTSSTAYATAAQGAKADTALQPSDVDRIGETAIRNLFN